MIRYVNTHRLFRQGEPVALCREVLANGPKSTRELALHVMESKGLNTEDKVLTQAIAYQLIHSLRQQALRSRIVRDGKKETVQVWRLP
jgi:hypothetical protein